MLENHQKEAINHIEKIEKEGVLLALVVRNNFQSTGTNFVSEDSWPFQVGFHKRKEGFRYKSHITSPFKEVKDFVPNKIYYVTKGTLGIDIYDQEGEKFTYIKINQGDLIIFVSGGHGVDLLDDSDFIEIKQGPYRGTEEDKRFLE